MCVYSIAVCVLYCYICVLILQYVCPHTTICVRSVRCRTAYYYICVLILLYVSSYYFVCLASRTNSFSFFFFRWRTRSPRSRKAHYYICVFILLHRPHTAMCVCQDHARTGGREEHAAGHQRCRRVLNKKSKTKKEQKKGRKK